jgi:hypothetical protein
MTNQEKIEKFKKITTEMVELYAKKNSNYGDSFGKLCEDLGLIAGLVPLHNKLDRLTNLIKGGENNFESIRDTLIDLANYAIMNLIEFERFEDTAAPDDNEECTISSSQTISDAQTRIFVKGYENSVVAGKELTGTRQPHINEPESVPFDYFEKKPDWLNTSTASNYPCTFCKRKNTTDCYNCKHSNINYCTYNVTASSSGCSSASKE